MEKRLLSAILFSPRGGSAHVTRALLVELSGCGWSVRLLSGSRSDSDGEADAEVFYSGIDLLAVDFAPALGEPDPIRPSAGIVPMHPSFEQRPGAPDPVFALLDESDFERQVDAWGHGVERAGAGEADVLDLHHLTPINEAASRVAPQVPIVTHLHGTELLMLEQIERGAPSEWAPAEAWGRRLHEWASSSARLVVSPAGLERASGLLEAPERKLTPLPNGFDPDVFHPLDLDRREHWRRHLVEEPTALLPNGRVLAYRERDLGSIREGVVLLYVGRFTKVKRVPLLLEVFAEARERFQRPAALVVVGGHPGEWRASTRRTRSAGSAAGRADRRLAAPGGAPRLLLSGRRGHPPLRSGAVRADPGRGHGLRPAGNRRERLRPRRDPHGRRDRVAGPSPTIATRWRTPSFRP